MDWMQMFCKVSYTVLIENKTSAFLYRLYQIFMHVVRVIQEQRCTARPLSEESVSEWRNYEVEWIIQAFSLIAHAGCKAAGMGWPRGEKAKRSRSHGYENRHGHTVASDACCYGRVLLLMAWVCMSIRLCMFSSWYCNALERLCNQNSFYCCATVVWVTERASSPQKTYVICPVGSLKTEKTSVNPGSSENWLFRICVGCAWMCVCVCVCVCLFTLHLSDGAF